MTISKIPEWGTFLVVLVVGFIAIIEYFEFKSENRILRSMEFAQALQTDRIVDDLVNLDKTVTAAWPKMRLKLALIEKDGAQDFYSREMVSIVKRAELQTSAIRTAVLLDSFAVCMERKLCDCETGLAFFGSTIAHAWPMIGPYVQEVSNRGREDGFGNSLERLSHALNKGKEPCA